MDDFINTAVADLSVILVKVCQLRKAFEDLSNQSFILDSKIQSLQLGISLMKQQFSFQQDRLRSVKMLLGMLRKLLGNVENFMMISRSLQSAVQSLHESNFDFAQENHLRVCHLQCDTEDLLDCNYNPDHKLIGMLKEYRKVCNKLHLVRSSLQAFVLGIGVCWAQDFSLLELTLNIGLNTDLNIN